MWVKKDLNTVCWGVSPEEQLGCMPIDTILQVSDSPDCFFATFASHRNAIGPLKPAHASPAGDGRQFKPGDKHARGGTNVFARQLVEHPQLGAFPGQLLQPHARHLGEAICVASRAPSETHPPLRLLEHELRSGVIECALVWVFALACA